MVSALRPSAERQEGGAGCHGTTNSVCAENLWAWLSPALRKGTPLQICLVSAGLRMFEHAAKAVWKEGWKR